MQLLRTQGGEEDEVLRTKGGEEDEVLRTQGGEEDEAKQKLTNQVLDGQQRHQVCAPRTFRRLIDLYECCKALHEIHTQTLCICDSDIVNM